MRFSHGLLAVVAATGLVVSSAQAQSIPGFGGGQAAQSGLGGLAGNALSGAVGNMLPNVSSASTSNIAGVLNYCVKDNAVSGGAASSVLNRLTGQQGVTSSSDYAAGQQGQLLTGGNNPFSLDDLKGRLKTKLCNIVLNRAKSLL